MVVIRSDARYGWLPQAEEEPVPVAQFLFLGASESVDVQAIAPV